MTQSTHDASQAQQFNMWDAPTPGYPASTPPSIFDQALDHTVDAYSPPLHREQPAQLGFLQVADWEEGRVYDEQPPTCIHYLIEWKVTLNNRVIAKDTEQDLVIAPGAYWELVLKQKAEHVLSRKIPRNRQVRLDDTTIVVSVNDRSQRDLTKRFDNTDIDWRAVEKQLLAWTNLFLAGKKLRFNISINYIEDSDHAIPRRGEKRGFSSTTQRMLSEREAQIDAENASGQPSIWRDVYKLMRCPGPPCDGRYCWQDPVGKKHYKLRTHHLKQLIKYVEQGGVLENHEDIPDVIQEQLYTEERQRLERQPKNNHHPTAGSSCQPININVLPTQPPRVSVPPTEAGTPNTSTPRADPVDIPGFLDEAVKNYSTWQQSRVSSEDLKSDIRRACDLALENGLDLKQIYEDQDYNFFIEAGVKIGVARRFVSDVADWVKQL